VSKPHAASLFLEDLKPLLAAGKVVFDRRSRRKMQEFLLREGLTEEDVLEIVGCLEPRHHVWGPDADDDGSEGDVMRFRYPYEGSRLYIKLKIVSAAGGNSGAVLSFHEEGTYD
jgi:hypothetical protein